MHLELCFVTKSLFFWSPYDWWETERQCEIKMHLWIAAVEVCKFVSRWNIAKYPRDDAEGGDSTSTADVPDVPDFIQKAQLVQKNCKGLHNWFFFCDADVGLNFLKKNRWNLQDKEIRLLYRTSKLNSCASWKKLNHN